MAKYITKFINALNEAVESDIIQAVCKKCGKNDDNIEQNHAYRCPECGTLTTSTELSTQSPQSPEKYYSSTMETASKQTGRGRMYNPTRENLPTGAGILH